MMSEILAKDHQAGELTRENINTLYTAGVIPKDTPKSQVMIFAGVCKEKRLSPFSKEIYLVNYGSQYAVITGIDGFRKIATRTGQYAGKDNCKFNLSSDGTYKTAAELIAAKQMPLTCTCTVYRIVAGQKVGFTHTAVFAEFAGRGKWQTMPFQMIQKVAEAFAIKQGFSDETSGLYLPEEKAAFEDAQVVTEPELDDDTKDEIRAAINGCKTQDELVKLFKANASWQTDNWIIDQLADRKRELTNQQAA